jgi:hypothetical protein
VGLDRWNSSASFSLAQASRQLQTWLSCWNDEAQDEAPFLCMVRHWASMGVGNHAKSSERVLGDLQV